MEKKRNRQADLNEDGSEESTESCEGSNGVKKCPHIRKSLNLLKLRRELKKTGIRKECAACQKAEKNSRSPKPFEVVEEGYEPCPPNLWICLQCGNHACGRDHRNHGVEHFKTLHSDAHNLVVDTREWNVWCYGCDRHLGPNYREKLYETVEMLKKSQISNVRPTPKAAGQASQKEITVAQEKDKPKILFGLTKVVGLVNLGNTCFFNAVLQCLAQTPFLVKVLEDLQKPDQTFVLPGGKHKKPGNSEEVMLPPIEGTLEYERSGNFTQVLRKTLTEMQNPNSQQTYKPSELLSEFRKKNTSCMDGGQHDSHELLRHLLEIVRNEDLRRYQSVILKHLDLRKLNSKSNAEVDEDKKSILKFYGHQASSCLLGPEPVFKGILVSTLECLECHHSSQRTEPFLDLSLPVMADKPQPPVYKRKNSGFEDAFDMMNTNSPNNAVNPPGKREIRAAKKAAKKEQKFAKKSLLRFSQLDNTLENNDSTDGDNSGRPEKQGDYLASVGSDTDVEDNVETESGTEPPRLKCQEILESGYSSEKASALASPVSPEDQGQALKDVNSSLDSLNDNSNLALVPADYYSPLKNCDKDNLKNAEFSMRNSANLELNFEKAIEEKTNSLSILESEASADLTSPDGTTDNLISTCNNLEKSSSSPVDENSEVSEEKIIENNGKNEQESLNEAKDDSLNFFGPNPEPESSTLSSPENKVNEHHSKSNKVALITSSLSRMGIHNHSNQSPTRYSTNEGEFSIQSCLNQFTAQELMSGNNKVGCEACTKKENKEKENGKMVCTPSTKQYLISKVPAVLILHLKRFQSQRVGFRKVTKHVNFPTLLDLAPVCKNHKKPKLYSLYGVVEHSGTLYGGHYVAYVKTRQPLSPNDPRWSFLPSKETTTADEESLSDSSVESEEEEASAKSTSVEPPPGRWYNISDSRISEVDESTVLQSQAYLLFYERIL